MNKSFLFSKLLAVALLLLVGVGTKAATYYVKINGSTAWANVTGGTVKELAVGDVISSFTTINASATGADTYYFAPGKYNINGLLSLTTGQFYGGFSGSETSVSDLTTRVTSDMDGNGIVEPWEFTNVVTFTTTLANGNYSGTGTGSRMITISGGGSGTTGEMNGITIYDYNYKTSGGNGVILLGESGTPSFGTTASYSGKMIQCIVQKIKNGTSAAQTSGIVMLTNQYSVVDQCLVKDNNVTFGSGTIFMNKYGGTVSNSVIRNNVVSAYAAGVYLGGSPTATVEAFVKNCAIYNNTSGTNAGAIRGDGNSTSSKGIQVVNCTVVNNKTTLGTSAAIELVNSGLIANTISLSDFNSEIRATQTTSYVVNNIYGASIDKALYPSTGNNNTSGIADLTFTALNFKNPTNFQGAVGNVTEGTYNETNYNAIKAANFCITSNSSLAYTTSNAVLPVSFKATGGTGSDIAITATVPGTDINFDSRNTIGAYNYDGTAPTVTITSSATSPTSISPIPVTFTFSENVTGFTQDDISVGNGTISALTAVSAKVFTANVTPSASGAVTVDVNANKVKDGAGNDNTAATQLSVTYQPVTTAPVGVSTTEISAITVSTATSGVTIASNGNSEIKASGVIWSTSASPTIELSTKTTDGSGSISGLNSGTLYHVRAYATNDIGTTYGNELSFTTPFVISLSSSDISKITVSGAGNYAGGSIVTVSASPESGYRFTKWTENGSDVSFSRNYSFSVSADRNLVANYGVEQSVYYVRPTGSTKWANVPGITADQIITNTEFNADIDALGSTKTYYLAAGNYTTNGINITTGKVYGGFTGNESSIDLNVRSVSDKDGNGMIEPWEFANEAVISTNNSNYVFTNATGITSGNRLAIIQGTGGELNGVTLTDYNYQGGYAGPICLGVPAQPATALNNISGKEGILRFCTVKKIKSSIGIVMSTNKYSIVDRCLIESNVVTNGNWGGAVYLNSCGGKVSGCVIRNNAAPYSNTGRSAGIHATSLTGADMDAIVENCLIYNNYASGNGGAIRCEAQASKRGIEVINATIVNNQTTATSNAAAGSVELINGGVIVNSIVVGDPSSEIRPNTTNNYIINTLYGEYATGAATLYGLNNVPGKTVTDFGFTNPTTFTGVMIPDYTTPWDQEKYDAIRHANFTISSNSSAAVTNPGIQTYPVSYPIGGSGTTVIMSTYSVPATDITGLNRTGNLTPGAYQATYIVATDETLTISKPATLASLIVASGAKLTVNEGVGVNISCITLQSDATGTATMLNNGTLTGTVTAQQYLGTARNWYVSSPVTNTASPSNNITRYYEYVESGNNTDFSVTGSTDYWKGLITGTTMAVGKGYIAQAGSGTTVSFSGTPNNANVTTVFDLTRDDAKGKGFNLVGNPYPSYLDWSLVASSNPNLSKTFYFRSKNTNETSTYTFVSYNGLLNTSVSSNGTANTSITRFIPPMQAFWVRVNSGTSATKMNFSNEMRAHRDDSGNQLKAPKTDNRVRLRLQLINGSEADETLICTDENAANGFDVYDSPKMMNNSSVIPDLYTKADAERLVINGINAIADNMELPLGFGLNATTTLKLKATEISNFPEGMHIYLLDKQENKPTELTPETEYTFSSTATTANESRFSLLFKAPGATTGNVNAENNQVLVFVNAQSEIVINAAAGSRYSVYNTAGQQIAGGTTGSDFETVNRKLNNGVYVVKVGSISKRVVLK